MGMTTLVLTIIGDERAGLVNALAEAVSASGGNWEGSRLAELAGKFAGIVVVTVPEERADELTGALRPLADLLDITVHPGQPAGTSARTGKTAGEGESAPAAVGSGAAGVADDGAPIVSLDLVGNDRPGIVREISGVLARHGLSIADMATATREAPMAGGRLFEARVVAPLPQGADVDAVRADLERLADEILVDITVDAS